MTRYGSRRACIWTSIGLCLALILPALALNSTTLFAALFFFGLMLGANDVAMNSQAVSVEKLLGSRDHVQVSRHVQRRWNRRRGGRRMDRVARRFRTAALAVMAAIFFMFSLATAPLLMEAAPAKRNIVRRRLRLRQHANRLAGAVRHRLLHFLSEGAMADWTAHLSSPGFARRPGLAAMGYAVFSAAMAVFRLCGDWITKRLGFAWTIRGGACWPPSA